MAAIPTLADISGPTTTESIGVSKDQAIESCRTNFNFLAALAMPEHFLYLWPDTYLQCWLMLVNFMTSIRDFSKIALGFPRGHAKSTFMKLVTLWAILFTSKRFILVICASDDLAKNFIEDVADFLEEDNIKAVFGDWSIGMVTNKQGEKVFHFRGRTIILKGVGTGTAMRGIIRKHARPDLMIFDDIQTREQADSDVETKHLEDWFYGTAMKAKSPHGCTFVFLGNMYPTPRSLLRRLDENPTWIKFITGAILSDGKALWEELQPLSQLLEEYRSDCAAGKADIFKAEVLNDKELVSNNLLDLSLLKPDIYTENNGLALPAVPHGRAIIIDPALDKKTSDAVAIGYHEYFVGQDGAIVDVFKEIVTGSFSPGEIIKESLLLGLRNNCRLIAIESAGFQASMIYWFNHICAQLNLSGFLFKEMPTRGRSKNARISELFKRLHSGEVILHRETKAAVTHEGVNYDFSKTNNIDNILDVCAYGPDLAALYPGEILVYDDILHIGSSADVIEHNSLF